MTKTVEEILEACGAKVYSIEMQTEGGVFDPLTMRYDIEKIAHSKRNMISIEVFEKLVAVLEKALAQRDSFIMSEFNHFEVMIREADNDLLEAAKGKL